MLNDYEKDLIVKTAYEQAYKEASKESQKAAKAYLGRKNVVMPDQSNVNSIPHIIKNLTTKVTERKTTPGNPIVTSGTSFNPFVNIFKGYLDQASNSLHPKD